MAERLRLDQAGTPAFLDTVYALLADSHRRHALQYLMSHREPASVLRLATELAAIEDEVPPEDVTHDRRQEVTLLLKHAQLPTLQEVGVIEWNREADLVTLTPILDHVSVSIAEPGSVLDVSVSTRSKTS